MTITKHFGNHKAKEEHAKQREAHKRKIQEKNEKYLGNLCS